MNVFDLDRALVGDYERFARSFTRIRADDIRSQIKSLYATDRFWPDPLIGINPNFERGAPIDHLADDCTVHASTVRVFRVGGHPIRLHRHQEQAVAKAAQRQSFVVTTGTGSGKSLCFFIPIIDSAIRARIGGEAQRTRAIVIYPMNALANSQVSELEKFIDQSELPEQQRPTFARYTGQESQDERERIREAKPDILLTNFMMLELLMTRQNALDRAVIANAHGLDFIVLDELHTYRGRQGADVAMLVRRVRDRLTGALMNAVLLRKGRAQQLSLDFGLSADATAMETKWRDAEEGERRSRARFAQNALKPEEVIPEWKRWRDLLGAPAEVRRFVTRSMSRLDAALEPDRDGTMRAHLAALPMSISERLDARGLEGTVRLAFEEPAPTGAELVTRSHPIPATLAESLLEGALDPGSSPVHALGRVGAWRTAAVRSRRSPFSACVSSSPCTPDASDCCWPRRLERSLGRHLRPASAWQRSRHACCLRRHQRVILRLWRSSGW